MDPILFAAICSLISYRANTRLDRYDVEEIHEQLNGLLNGIKEKAAEEAAKNARSEFYNSATHHETANVVRALMLALQDGRKIDAIKMCRTLTGDGLKEAKDMVEETIRGVVQNSI